MVVEWKCPECGTGYERGRGLVCECENGANAGHGISVNDICVEARCSKCGWCGSLPAKRETLVAKMIKEAFVGEEYARVLDETQRYFANEAAAVAQGKRTYKDEEPAGRGVFPAIVSFATLKRLMVLAGEKIDSPED